RQETVDEDFMQLDLWLYNAALVSFAAVFCLEVMRTTGTIAQILKQRDLAQLSGVFGQAFRQALTPLNYVLLFSLVLKNTRGMRQQRTLSLGTVCALVLAITLSGVEGGLHGFEARGERGESPTGQIVEGDGTRKHSGEFDALRRKVEPLMAARQYADALNEMTALEAGFPRQAEANGSALLPQYLKGRKGEDFHSLLTRPLAPEHAFLAPLPEEELLLTLYLWNGLLEPLSERYAWGGFPQWQDPEGLAAALESFRSRPENSAGIEAEYLAGVLKWQQRRFLAARQHFERVLERFPGHSNATVFLERIARERGDEKMWHELQSSRRRLGGMQDAGSGVWATVSREALWMPFEMNPGSCEVVLDVQLPGRGRREVRVLRTDRKMPLLREVIACGERQALSFRCDAKEAGWYGIRIETGRDKEDGGATGLELLGGEVRFQAVTKP
ncbi:MAG TPA: hypothetical protein PLA90_02610, partial [Candidatus Sumerlaeota bacterium]|nr:hypothetical protein [Candidatus Sumerlaeota bacterium]